jgi:hypothetical protein
MSDLIVVAFDNETGAENMRDALVGMQKRHVVTLEDAAVVVRKQDGKVKVKQAVNLVGEGALGGAFWGTLYLLISQTSAWTTDSSKKSGTRSNRVTRPCSCWSRKPPRTRWWTS